MNDFGRTADELIDRKKALSVLGKIENALKRIRDFPPIVVRCKDCKLSPWRPMRFNDPSPIMTVCTFTRDPNGFCSWAERATE